jgi:hypothetical protein
LQFQDRFQIIFQAFRKFYSQNVFPIIFLAPV